MRTCMEHTDALNVPKMNPFMITCTEATCLRMVVTCWHVTQR